MNDAVGMVSRKHCGWCFEENDDTAWNRFWGLDVAERKEEWSRRKRIAIKLSNFWTVKFPVWKIASSWHYRFHVHQPRKWKEL